MAQHSEAYSAFGSVIKVFGVIQVKHVYLGKKRIPQGVSQLLWHLALVILHLLQRNRSPHLFSSCIFCQFN